MPRKPRIHQPGGLYHVILRGNNGQGIFLDDRGRMAFLALLTEGTRRFGYRIHAFCLMSNHVHLAIQAGDEPLSKAMQNVGFRHALRTNRKQGSTGHVFQGRFKAILVADTAYAYELVRYVHRNPVRAGLAQDLADWRWSSHRAYLGIDSWAFLTTSWVLEMFGDDPADARRRYLEFVLAPDSSPGGDADGGERTESLSRREDEAGLFRPSKGVAGGVPAAHRLPGTGRPGRPGPPGRPLETETAPGRHAGLDEVVRTVSFFFGTTPERLLSPIRGRFEAEVRSVVVRVALGLRSASVTDVARFFGRDPSTLSHGLRRLQERAESDAELSCRIAALLELFGSSTPTPEYSDIQV